MEVLALTSDLFSTSGIFFFFPEQESNLLPKMNQKTAGSLEIAVHP